MLLAVHEANQGDLNGDGDAGDDVAAVFDGNSVHNLGLAVMTPGIPIRMAWTGSNTALIGVSEAGQGQDLDGNGSATGTVTFAVTYQPSAPEPVFDMVTPARLLDTRADGPQIGYIGPKPSAGQTIRSLRRPVQARS